MTTVKFSKSEDSNAIFLERRKAALQRYLSRIAKHPVLRKDADFIDFLENPAEVTDMCVLMPHKHKHHTSYQCYCNQYRTTMEKQHFMGSVTLSSVSPSSYPRRQRPPHSVVLDSCDW